MKWLLFCTSIICSVLFNVYNQNYIRENYPNNNLLNTVSLYRGISVYSVDNEYYLSPPTNYLLGKGWLRDPCVSDADAVRRVPGYSLLYLFGRVCFGEDGALWFLIILQTLLYGLFSICMYDVMRWMGFGFRGFRLLLLILFALPLFYSSTFFTITEGVTIFLSGFLIYFIIKAKHAEKQKALNYFFASLVFTSILLIRPLGAIGGLMFILIFTENKTNILRLSLISSVVPLLSLSVWTYRNYKVTGGEIILLEKAYNPKSIDYFKIDLKGMADLYKCWGAGGIEMTENVLWFIHSVTEQNDSTDRSINAVYSRLPEKAKAVIEKKEFFDALRLHQVALFEKQAYATKLLEMPSEYLPSQIAAYEKYMKLKQKYISAYPFDFYILSPLRYLKQMIFHSNTSHVAFLNSKELPFHFKLLKGALFIIHVLLYLINIIVLFQKKSFEVVLICWTSTLAILFFMFYFKEVEQVYMNPFLPFLLICSVYFIQSVLNKFKTDE